MKVNKTLFFIFCFIFAHLAAMADPKADSLLLQLKKAKEDTVRIRIYNELSAYYTKIKPDTAFYYVNQAINLSNRLLKQGDEATKQKVNILMSHSYTHLGNYYKALGDYEKATLNYKKSLEIKKLVQDLKGIAYSYIDLGSVKSLNGNYELAEEYYKKALEIQLKINDDPGLAKLY